MFVSKEVEVQVDVEVDDEDVIEAAKELGMLFEDDWDPPSLIEQFKELPGIDKDQFLSALRDECRLMGIMWPV